MVAAAVATTMGMMARHSQKKWKVYPAQRWRPGDDRRRAAHRLPG